jgi:acetyl-CoA C-acetyltransferase
MRRVVIASYRRTPFVKFAGVFQGFSAVELGAIAAKAAIAEAGISPSDIDYVVAGQVLQGLAGQNPARQTAVAVDVPWSVPSVTINAVCLSGTEAVAFGTRLIATGERDVVLVVGQESMSQAPHAAKLRSGSKYGALELLDTVEQDGLTDAFSKSSMGVITDAENLRLGLTREEQDEWALRSHQLAEQSMEFLSAEIVPVDAGKNGVISADNGPRFSTTAESLAGLKPAFSATGTITAGNASQITDGAAAIVLMSAETAERLKLKPIAEVLSHAQVGGPDATLQSQPANAIFAALKKVGLEPSQLESVEINEAFAGVTAASVSQLGISKEIVNPHSGAIALGHPIGASGTRIVGHLARSLAALGPGKIGAVGICGGGGQGSAVILKAL